MPGLYEAWKSSPYNDANLAKKTFSYRFPVHIAARLAAIEQLFPDLSRSQVIIEILKQGLKEFEKSLPEPYQGWEYLDEPRDEHYLPEGHPDYIEPLRESRLMGPKVDYVNAANWHYEKLEKERGNDAATLPFKL